ncbi:MAG: hypothetical protein ABIR70_10605 [Bryobacteraceae bacterium]
MPPDFIGLPGTALRRFEESMLFDYGHWRDGDSLDLDALRAMSPGERGLIEPRLKGSTDWRNVEALAELKSLDGPFSPTRTADLVLALGTKSGDDGLLAALDQVPTYHPAEVVAALWRGVRYRKGDDAIAFARVLLFLHRKSAEHDFLEGFHSPETATRATALHHLCQEVGVTRPS